MLTLDDLLAAIARDIGARTPPLAAYWYECSDHRERVASEVALLAQRVCMVPLIVRHGFDNPNTLLNDLAALLDRDAARYQETIVAAGIDGRPVALVLLSKTRFWQPQIASPIRLPDWFPYGGGTIRNIVIVDLQAGAAQTLEAERSAVGRLQALNYEIQGAVLARLQRRHAEGQNNTAKFFGQILGKDETAPAFMRAASDNHSQSKASEFRATAHPGRKEMLGRLVYKAGTLTPQDLPQFADSLFAALGIPDINLKGLPEPFAAVALRSTNKDVETDPLRRTKRNVVLAIYCSSQVVTAAAHSAEYGEFKTMAMRGFIDDCLGLLLSFKRLLE